MASGKYLNHKDIRNSSLLMWVSLYLATAAPILAIVVWKGLGECPGCGWVYYWQPRVLGALAVATPFAILGLLIALYRNNNARDLVAKAVSATFLDDDHPLAQRVHHLSDQLSLPRPHVGVMPGTNALAVGSSPDDAAVIVGRSLINQLSPDELDAVIGHELGHIASGDMSRMQMAIGFQKVFVWFFAALGFVFWLMLLLAGKSNSRHRGSAQFGAAISLLGAMVAQATFAFCTTLFVCGLSRRREFHADAVGAFLTSPETMRQALRRVHGVEDEPSSSGREYRMLMFQGVDTKLLWSTHPTLEAREQALREGHFLRKLEGKAFSQDAHRYDTADGGWIDAEPQTQPHPEPREISAIQLAALGLLAGVVSFGVVWELLPG